MRARRPRWRAYLLLARISNIPTIWSNVLAGMLATGVSLDADLWLRIAAASSFFYTGGMFLNDAFDADIDSVERPERPLPSGDVTRREVFAIASGLFVAGLALLPVRALPFAVALVAAIVLYDFRHKGHRFAPVIMGTCRGLVYCVAAAASASITPVVIIAAAALTSYVAMLTVAARVAGRRARWLVPLLIAGISLVDSAVILATSHAVDCAFIAAMGFPLTLVFQRAVPGD